MAIDETKYHLADRITGDILGSETRIARKLEGARMYDIGEDADEYARYGAENGLELYGPDEEGLDLMPVTQFSGLDLVAIDSDQGTDHTLSSLVLVPYQDDQLGPDEIVELALSDDMAVPYVSSAVVELEGLPFESVND